MTPLLAQLTNPVLPPSIGAGGTAQGGTAVGLFISNLISLLLIVAFLFTFFFLILGGIQWLTSSGDKASLEQARDKITHAIVGLIIVSAAWAIMILVGQFIGITFPILHLPSITGQ